MKKNNQPNPNELTKSQVEKIIENLKLRYYVSPKEYGIRLLYTPIHKKKGYQAHGARVLHTNNF